MQSRAVSPELQAISDRAYLYAYGIDEAYKHLHKTLVEPDCPANRFQIIHHLADDKYTAHVSINNDTLHLMGWLDVTAEPVIVSVPDHDDGRYWVLHTMDMGHYTTTMEGKRTRGTKGGGASCLRTSTGKAKSRTALLKSSVWRATSSS